MSIEEELPRRQSTRQHSEGRFVFTEGKLKDFVPNADIKNGGFPNAQALELRRRVQKRRERIDTQRTPKP